MLKKILREMMELNSLFPKKGNFFICLFINSSKILTDYLLLKIVGTPLTLWKSMSTHRVRYQNCYCGIVLGAGVGW